MATEPTNLPAETPAETAAPMPAAEASLTSHLDSFKPAPETESEQTEAEEVKADVKLPKTAKEAHELLSKIQNQEVTTPAEARQKAANISALAAHIHKLAQGPQAKPITGKAQASLANAATSHAVDIHILNLRRGDMILDAYIADLEMQIADLSKKK